MKFDAVILAGGKSARMGTDKAFLKLDGKTLLERQVRLAREVGASEVFISAPPNAAYDAFGCPLLHDRFLDVGPLAGIERALTAGRSNLLLTLAVDMPHMTAAVLRHLFDSCSEVAGVVPKTSGQIEPLAAFYPKTAHPLLIERLERGFHSTRRFAEACANAQLIHFLDVPDADAPSFHNWNSNPRHSLRHL